MLEVGPGLGSLTLALLAAAGAVIAVEIDPVLAAALPRTVADRAPDLAGRLDRGHRRRGRASRSFPGRPADRAGRQPALQRRRAGAAAPAGDAAVAARAVWSWCRPRSPTGWRAARQPDLRRAVGQGGLVRRRPAGGLGAAGGVLAGAQRRLRSGRVHPPRAAGRGEPEPRSSPWSTPRSPSGARRCGPRWPAGPGSPGRGRAGAARGRRRPRAARRGPRRATRAARIAAVAREPGSRQRAYDVRWTSIVRP